VRPAVGPARPPPRRHRSAAARRHLASIQPRPFTRLPPHAADLTLDDAWQLLRDLTRRDIRGQAGPLVDSADKRRRLRDALLVAASAPLPAAGWVHDADPQPEVLIGVVASDVRLAVRALRDYCAALGLDFVTPESRVPGAASLPAVAGPVYVKLNSRTRVCYASRYEGRERGVLVQLGAEQVGHLPLGLHDEGMAAPPPALL
jgi:hypothetical protein